MSESFKRKLILNLFACNLIIGYLKKNRKNFPWKAFEQRNKKKPWLKVNPGLSLIGLQTTGPCSFLDLTPCLNKFHTSSHLSKKVPFVKTLSLSNMAVSWHLDFLCLSLDHLHALLIITCYWPGRRSVWDKTVPEVLSISWGLCLRPGT